MQLSTFNASPFSKSVEEEVNEHPLALEKLQTPTKISPWKCPASFPDGVVDMSSGLL